MDEMVPNPMQTPKASVELRVPMYSRIISNNRVERLCRPGMNETLVSISIHTIVAL